MTAGISSYEEDGRELKAKRLEAVAPSPGTPQTEQHGRLRAPGRTATYRKPKALQFSISRILP